MRTNDDISLFEILDVVRKGKKIILLTVIIATVIAFVLNYFVIKPTYQATALVAVNTTLDDKSPRNLNAYAQQMNSEVMLNNIVEKLKSMPDFSNKDFSTDNLTIELKKDTNLIEITAVSEDPLINSTAANYAAFKLSTQIEMADRADIVVNANKRLLEVNSQIVQSQKQIEGLTNELAKTPEKISVKKVLAEDQILRSLSPNQSGTMSPIVSEEVNPVYVNLKDQLSKANAELAKAQADKADLEKRITEYGNEKNETLENEFLENVKSKEAINLLSGFKAVIVTPAYPSEKMVSPRKVVNTASTALASFILCILFLLVKNFIVKRESQ